MCFNYHAKGSKNPYKCGPLPNKLITSVLEWEKEIIICFESYVHIQAEYKKLNIYDIQRVQRKLSIDTKRKGKIPHTGDTNSLDRCG